MKTNANTLVTSVTPPLCHKAQQAVLSAMGIAEKVFERTKALGTPFFVSGDEKIEALAFNIIEEFTPHNKQAVFDLVLQTARKFTAVVFVMEGYHLGTTAKTEEEITHWLNSEESISDHPQRHEVVNIILYNNNRQLTIIAVIHPTERTLGPWQVVGDTAQGWMQMGATAPAAGLN